MSFERTIEGDSIEIITNRDFMLSTEVNVENCEDALQILSSKRNRKITSAENKNGRIYITRHFCTCPLCGKRLSAYVTGNLTKNPYLSKNIADMCDNQLSLLSEEKIKSILFQQPMKIGNSVKCPHCGFEGVISNEMINCVITSDQDKLGITYFLQSFSEIMNMSWIPKEVLSFDDAHCSETITFDLQNGSVTVSLNCGSKELCSITAISSKTLGMKEPLLLMFKNRRIFREIKRSFEKIYGVLPFSNKLLTFDKLILLTKFVGYQADFFRDLPLSIDDETTILPEEFDSISDRLHYSDSVPSIFSEINIPKVKSIKRIIFNRPSFLLYEKELEKLWKIIDNIDLYCALLSEKNIFTLLAYLHLYPGIDVYLIEVRKIKGTAWLQKMLASHCYDLCRRGIEYLSANSTIRCKLLKNDVEEIRYSYYDLPFYFSVPMSICLKHNTISFVSDLQFIFLANLKDYYIVGKELHNCLDTYSPDNDSKVYLIRNSKKILGAIEIYENQIVQVLSRNNAPINSKSLINAITVWSKRNSFLIDDNVFES